MIDVKRGGQRRGIGVGDGQSCDRELGVGGCTQRAGNGVYRGLIDVVETERIGGRSGRARVRAPPSLP